jgi:hypothetical protein
VLEAAEGPAFPSPILAAVMTATATVAAAVEGCATNQDAAPFLAATLSTSAGSTGATVVAEVSFAVAFGDDGGRFAGTDVPIAVVEGVVVAAVVVVLAGCSVTCVLQVGVCTLVGVHIGGVCVVIKGDELSVFVRDCIFEGVTVLDTLRLRDCGAVYEKVGRRKGVQASSHTQPRCLCTGEHPLAPSTCAHCRGDNTSLDSSEQLRITSWPD